MSEQPKPADIAEEKPAESTEEEKPAEATEEEKPAPAQQSQMTREEFLASMGLTADDVVPPAAPNNEFAVRGVDTDEDGIDETFIRHVDLSKPLMEAANATPDVDHDYRKTQLDRFRTSGSVKTTTESEEPDTSPLKNRPENDARNDHAAAHEYQQRMLEEFRNRKSCGMNKSPPRQSPRREAKPAEA